MRSLIVFDSDDRVVETLNVKCGTRIEDSDHNYNIVTLEPSLRRICVNVSKGNALHTIVVFATHKNKVWTSEFSWRQFRVFSRPAEDNELPEWPMLASSSVGRSHLFGRHITKVEKRPAGEDILWGVKVPLSSISSRGTEFFVCRRPIWQRAYARTYSVAVEPDKNTVEVLFSHPPSTLVTRPVFFKGPLINSARVLAYCATVPVRSNHVTIYYLPADPLVLGDAVVVFYRYPAEQKQRLFDGQVGHRTTNSFVSIVIRHQQRFGQTPILEVSIGGMDRLILPYRNLKYTLRFLDGTTLTGSLDAHLSALLEWPTHIPVSRGYLSATGYLIDDDGQETTLTEAVYSIVSADSAFVGSTGYYAERNVDDEENETSFASSGYSVVIPRSAFPPCELYEIGIDNR
jgi:hypothetical protein